MEVKLPDKAQVSSDWVWTLKLEGVTNVNKGTYKDKVFEESIKITKVGEH